MNRARRCLAILLCAATLCGLLPGFELPVHAAGDTVYVLAGGDFQEAGDHANSAANVTNILTQVSQKYDTMDGFLFIGDYDCETHDSATETANGITALMGAVQGTYSNINDANSILVQGNHDYMDSRIDATGGHEFDAYSVYVLNEDDYANGGGSDAQVKNLANNMEAWLNNKLGEGYSAPIFITSHLPLAFSPRTVTQGDAKYAKYLFDVLNTAAAQGLNIIFMHGHDHAYGPDNYMGGEAIYLPKGESICIAEAGSTSAWTEETLNFTYMNAGYTGYYSDPYTYVTTAGTDKLTMTVFAITDNKVTVERYSENGLYNLKSAGYDGSYSNTSVTNISLGLKKNETVYASPQTIMLNDLSTTDESTIGEYVEVPLEDVTDNVTPKFLGWIETVAPIKGELNEDVITSDDWVTITEPIPGTEAIPGTTTYQYKLDTNGADYGESYLIVGSDSNYAMTDSSNRIDYESVAISNDTITLSTQDYEWTIDSEGRIYAESNGTKYYLMVEATPSWGGSLSLATNEANATKLEITHIENGEYKIWTSDEYTDRWGNTTKVTLHLYFNNGRVTKRFAVSTQSQSIRLFGPAETITEGGTEATPGTPGLYGKLDGILRYEVAAGTSAEAALAAVKAGIAIKYATKADYSDEATFEDDGEGMTWTLDPSYDPNVPGDYAVTIAYNGTVLGIAKVVVPAGGDQDGEYYKLSGNKSYEVTAGTSAEDALAAVKEGIDGYQYMAMSAPAESVVGTKVDDSELTWVLDSSYDPNVPGDYPVTISKNGKTLGTAEVIVPASAKYYIAEGNGMYFVSMNTAAEDAMAAVMAGVTVSVADDTQGTNKQTIDDSMVTWNWVDTYDGTNYGPYTVEILYEGTSLGTVEVKVNVQYETGIKDGWTFIETSTGESTYNYTLDTDGIDYGEEHKYIIVDDNENIVLNANSSSNGTAHAITINGNTATLDTRDYEYHMIQETYNEARYELITKGDGSEYLYQESEGVRYGIRSSVKFQINHHGYGIYDIHDIDGTNWYIIYNGGWTVTKDTSARVRLYKYTGQTTSGGGDIYAKIEGNTVYTVQQGKSSTSAKNVVKAGITGYLANNSNGTDATVLEDSELDWEWKNNYNGNNVGSYWLDISYKGEHLGTVEVQVQPAVIDNDPEYPEPGAVKVNKTVTGIDFQSTGIAQVELSASGIPVEKGADVIIMLDTSSSMTTHTVTGTDQTRAAVLEASLTNLIAQFKTPGDDGELLDIRVAIADFNGFYGENHNASGTPYDRDAADMMSDDIFYNANSEAKVYTGDGTLTEGAFISVEDLAASYTLNYTSGTNYDYAMDAIYQLGSAAKDSATEERDLYVIFMSDGAAMQWNYYHSQGASSLWNNWITGAWTEEQLNLNCTTHAYYYDEVDHNGDGMRNEHRMANAIKGDPSEEYEVIRKTDTLGTPTDETNMYMVPGLGATMFAISFDAQADNNVTEESMDKSIASLATEQSGSAQYYYKVTSAEELDQAFRVIGSEIAYAATNARYVDKIGNDFSLQLKTYDYEVTDEKGATTKKTVRPVIEILSYDIWTRQDFLDNKIAESQIGDRKGTYTVNEVIVFSLDGTKAYSNLIDADRDGEYGVNLADYSINDEDDNILDSNGVIYAKTFVYNTTEATVTIEGLNIPGAQNTLDSETFYWKMDTITTTELALRYYVYLDGSMEGTREAGSYATNEYAILYYTNFRGVDDFQQATTPPTIAWQSANVSYAFYLVNEKGEIIVNQTTGQVGTFANKIAVTQPVVYKELLLNNVENINALSIAAMGDGVLPKYYQVYDQKAAYTITVNSNATGSWEIEKGDGLAASTYVTQYKLDDPSAYSNVLTNNSKTDDYTHTIVWFAVVWTLQAHPDTVVIDYGLPVDISVLSNDMFGAYGKLAAVGPYTEDVYNNYIHVNSVKYSGALESGFGNTYDGDYGQAEVNQETGKVRYTPDTMSMDGYEQFIYAVHYTGSANPGYYYDTVTVIPATTVYYEDNFLTFEKFKEDGTEDGTWGTDGEEIDGVQAEDRPGRYSLTDANNIYGYDAVNLNMTTHSLGHARMVHVDADSYATATFTFTGTGFDVIGMTSNTTGAIAVEVKDADGNVVANKIVNTYYGYEHVLCEVTYAYLNDEWVQIHNTKATGDSVPGTGYMRRGVEMVDGVKCDVAYVCYDGTNWELLTSQPTFAEDPLKLVDRKSAPTNNDTKVEKRVELSWLLAADTTNALYQVPVLQIENLPHGSYTATITATYLAPLDKTSAEGYDLYLDAIRIYNPAGDGVKESDTTIQDAYIADGEAWPKYLELRNRVIDEESFGDTQTDTVVTGIVFIDGDATVGDAEMADYVSYGPNNEIYLAPGQCVAFMINDRVTEHLAKVHIGISSADGNAATYTISNIAQVDIEDGPQKGSSFNVITHTVSTTTDMYYDMTGYEDYIVVVSNVSNSYGTTGILSLTNIKFTFTSDPDAIDPVNTDDILYMTKEATDLTLRTLNTKQEDRPEEEIPEVTEPETTEPGATEPEEPVEPDTSARFAQTVVDRIVAAVNWLLGKREI